VLLAGNWPTRSFSVATGRSPVESGGKARLKLIDKISRKGKPADQNPEKQRRNDKAKKRLRSRRMADLKSMLSISVKTLLNRTVGILARKVSSVKSPTLK